VALNATIYTFEITLNDADRGIYEALSFRAARHPSETEEFLLTRVLAYCLEYREGIAFSKGLSDPDAPALEIRELTGTLQSWIDIGTPDPSRLHRTSKAAPRVDQIGFEVTHALLEPRLGGPGATAPAGWSRNAGGTLRPRPRAWGRRGRGRTRPDAGA
jgi:uncharacterized protein YaeQ